MSSPEETSYTLRDLQLVGRLLRGESCSPAALGILAAPLQPVARLMLAANGSGRAAVLDRHDPLLLRLAQDALSRRGPAGMLPFPVDTLPSPLRELVAEGAAATGTPPEFVALPALAITAGAVGNGARLHIKDSWQERANIWFAVVAEASTGKSPALTQARLPVNRLMSEAEDRYQREQADYEQDLDDRAKAKAGNRGVKPAAPVRERFVTTDATLEGLRRVLVQNPGLAMLQDELTFWLRGMGRYNDAQSAERSAYLAAWNGDPIVVDRAQAEYVYHPDPVIALCGGIQPMFLPELAEQAGRGDGMLERFLFAYPAADVLRYTEEDVSRSTVDAVAGLLGRLRAGARRGKVLVPLDAGARSRWRDWSHANTERQRELDGITRSYYAKLPRQLAKLLLLLHVAAHPETPGTPASAAELDDAITLTDYFRYHAQRTVLSMSSAAPPKAAAPPPLPDADALLARRVLLALERLAGPEPRWVNQSELNSLLRLTAEQRQQARDVLLAEGRIEVTIQTGKGRPAERWRLCPPGTED